MKVRSGYVSNSSSSSYLIMGKNLFEQFAKFVNDKTLIEHDSTGGFEAGDGFKALINKCNSNKESIERTLYFIALLMIDDEFDYKNDVLRGLNIDCDELLTLSSEVQSEIEKDNKGSDDYGCGLAESMASAIHKKITDEFDELLFIECGDDDAFGCWMEHKFMNSINDYIPDLKVLILNQH